MRNRSANNSESGIFSQDTVHQKDTLAPELEQLKSLEGAEVTEKNDAIIINVIDKEKWEKEIDKLEKIFGQTIFKQYESRMGEFDPNNPEHVERMRHQCQVSFSGIDQMYVLVEDKNPIGFTAIEQYGEKGCSILRDIILDVQARGQGKSKKLYSLILENPELLTLLGYSKTPEAIKSRTATGHELGFNTYYGSEGAANPDAEAHMKITLEYLKERGLLAEDADPPPGYAMLNGQLEILPAKTLDLSSIENKNLLRSLTRLNELQTEELHRNNEKNTSQTDENKRLSNSVVGLLISTRRIN